jgi:hypothetical protein
MGENSPNLVTLIVTFKNGIHKPPTGALRGFN